MAEWLEYEPTCLHEYRPDVLQEWDVTVPRLSTREYRWIVGNVQKYSRAKGSPRWRSLDSRRNVFRDDYLSRESCAQELVRDCPVVVRRMAHRRLRLAAMALEDLSPEARRARVA
jgi:hypothetical protein